MHTSRACSPTEPELVVTRLPAQWFMSCWYGSCSLVCCLRCLGTHIQYELISEIGTLLHSPWVHLQQHGLITSLTVLGGTVSVSSVSGLCCDSALQTEVLVRFREWNTAADVTFWLCKQHSCISHSCVALLHTALAIGQCLQPPAVLFWISNSSYIAYFCPCCVRRGGLCRTWRLLHSSPRLCVARGRW